MLSISPILIPSALLIAAMAIMLMVAARRSMKLQKLRAERLSLNLDRIREDAHQRILFLNTISHNLRTPLNQITLQAHIIEIALAKNETAMLGPAIEDIRTSAALAAEILSALLQYANTALGAERPLSISPVNVRNLVQQVGDPFRAAAEEKRLAFNFSVPGDLVVHSDRDKLQKILAILLDNALKFTTHGSITVEGRHEPPSANFACPVIRITITDTGSGIAKADQPRLFREFFQAHNPNHDPRLGLGLGLVIAQRLTQELQGNLVCQSPAQPGVVNGKPLHEGNSAPGCRFILTVPANPPVTSSP